MTEIDHARERTWNPRQMRSTSPGCDGCYEIGWRSLLAHQS